MRVLPHHKNYLDHVYAVSDKDGDIKEHYRYTAFGEAEIYNTLGQKLAESAIANANDVLWNSRRFDAETGLCYYKYRYYASKLGRWLGRDPIEERGGVNLYAFVGNEPVGSRDIYGLAFTDSGTTIRPMGNKPTTQYGGTPATDNPPVLVGNDVYEDLPVRADSWENGRARGKRCYCVRLKGAELDLVASSWVIRYDDLQNIMTAPFHAAVILHEQRRRSSMRLGYEAYTAPANQKLSDVICCEGNAKKARKKLAKYAAEVRKRATSAYTFYVNEVNKRITAENSSVLRTDGLMTSFGEIFTPQAPSVGNIGAFGGLPAIHLKPDYHPNTFLNGVTLKCSRDPSEFKPAP